MPRLIKRIVTTEEFIQTDEEDVNESDSSKLDDESDDETDEDEAREEGEPTGRRRRPSSDRRPR